MRRACIIMSAAAALAAASVQAYDPTPDPRMARGAQGVYAGSVAAPVGVNGFVDGVYLPVPAKPKRGQPVFGNYERTRKGGTGGYNNDDRLR